MTLARMACVYHNRRLRTRGRLFRVKNGSKMVPVQVFRSGNKPLGFFWTSGPELVEVRSKPGFPLSDQRVKGHFTPVVPTPFRSTLLPMGSMTYPIFGPELAKKGPKRKTFHFGCVPMFIKRIKGLIGHMPLAKRPVNRINAISPLIVSPTLRRPYGYWPILRFSGPKIAQPFDIIGKIVDRNGAEMTLCFWPLTL